MFCITGLTGTADGQSATLLATSGPGLVTNSSVVNNWFIEYDNLLSFNQPYFDLWGLGMTLADGSLANLYDNGGYLFQECVTIQSVPEPGTLVLLCAGLPGLGFLPRKQLA